MIKNPLPFKGLNIRIPIIIPTMGRGFINKGSALPSVNRNYDLGLQTLWFSVEFSFVSTAWHYQIEA